MSSENRWMRPKTFESAVPPLKTRLPANSDSKSTPSNQQTQKSFSMITGDRFLRSADCSMTMRRSAGVRAMNFVFMGGLQQARGRSAASTLGRRGCRRGVPFVWQPGWSA